MKRGSACIEHRGVKVGQHAETPIGLTKKDSTNAASGDDVHVAHFKGIGAALPTRVLLD
jgi:hypothetical protein